MSDVESEEVEIRTRDGAVLRALVTEPADARGTFVLAHALFARASSFGKKGRPGLATLLAERGWRTIAFDFRGHGASTSATPWRYDDLVRVDLPAVVEMAQARFEDGPVLVAGHSLGGHVALAAQGTGRMKADGFLLLATNLWMPEVEPSLRRRLAKRVVAGAVLPLVARLREVPARRLGFGSDDAPADAVARILESGLGRPWTSDDGEDYLEALSAVTAPVCAVVSAGDRLACTPSAGAAFARRCRGPVEVVAVTASDDGGPPPGHMELATTLRARSAVLGGLAWLDARAHVRR